jgi:hypothetical protein
MQITRMIFAGSLAAFVATMAPALAKNAQTPKTDEQASSSSCHAYQQAPDGTWTALPCQARGGTTQNEHRSATASSGDEQR